MGTRKKSIGLCLLIILTFSLVWIPSALANIRGEKEAIVLEVKEGDPSTVSSLVVELLLTDDSSSNFVDYRGEEAPAETNPLSWYQKFDGTGHAHLDTYVAEYRSFMRGKATDPTLFAETEENLLYVGQPSDVHWQYFNDHEFSLSLLDKETKEESTYSFYASNQDIPTGVSFDIQRVIPQLPYIHVLVDGFYEDPRGSNMEVDLFLFTINLDELDEEQSEELPLEQTFANKTNSPPSIQIASDPKESYPYLVLRSIEMDETDDAELSPGDYYLYHIETAEWIEMNLHEELTYAHVFIEDDTFYVLDRVENQFNVYEYSVDTNELSPLSTFSVDSLAMGASDSNHYSNFVFAENILVKDDKALLYETGYELDEESPLTTLPLQVNDLNTGELLFKGDLIPNEDQNVNEVSLELLSIDW